MPRLHFTWALPWLFVFIRWIGPVISSFIEPATLYRQHNAWPAA